MAGKSSGELMAAAIVGFIGATIICGALVYGLFAAKAEFGLIWYFLLCGAGVAACLLIARWMDKRDAAHRRLAESSRPKRE